MIDYKLPVLNVNKNYWWGYFNEKAKNERQAQFFERFKNLKVNPLDNCELIVNDLRMTLIHYGDINGPTSSNSEYNASAFFKRLKQYNYYSNVESKKEKEVRNNSIVSGNNDNHL